MPLVPITGSREPLDVVCPITAKLAFITDLLTQQTSGINAELHLSARGCEGFYWFLREIEDDLETVLPRLHDLPLEV